MCIICTWPPLVGRFNFLMLQSPSIFTIFHLLTLHFPLFFKSVPFFPSVVYEIMLPAAVGSTILEIGTHQLGPQKSQFRPVRTHYRRQLGTVFRFQPLHSRKARFQKPPQICVLFLQFSSVRLALRALAPKYRISSSMVIAF